MLNQFTYSLTQALQKDLDQELQNWKTNDKVGRIWNKDASVWTNSGEEKWLGWLEIVEQELNDLKKYKDLADDINKSDFESIVLLGMGGSSLCPEVFSITFGKKHFHILDSTVPAQIKTLDSKIDVAKTLFIVASKSGSTLEPNAFKQFFYKKVADAVGEEKAGRHFIAITDPDSKLQKLAERDGFRHIFYGDPTVGGRFSALSVFGMIPATAMGLDSVDFLTRSMEMVHACKSHLPNENPGTVLGTILGVCHKNGRDKLTIFTSPELYDVGAWLEQLIAESTGKHGVSIIPVDREEIQNAESYGNDRIFVYLTLYGSENSELDRKITEIEKIGQPVIRITLQDKENLGQEFFRWEFATAVAGAIMEINPFDQPDVEAAKIEAKKITSAYEETGKLPDENAFFEENGLKLFTDERNLSALNESINSEKSLDSYLKAFLSQILENDYFALLGYIEMDAENEKLLQKIRHLVLKKHNVATCLGFGPRFLHSTGQGYKGGANNGVFLQITSDDAEDILVPDQKYTFGVVKSAQSRGDFQVLLDRKKRALRVHLSEDVKADLKKLCDLL